MARYIKALLSAIDSQLRYIESYSISTNLGDARRFFSCQELEHFLHKLKAELFRYQFMRAHDIKREARHQHHTFQSNYSL